MPRKVRLLQLIQRIAGKEYALFFASPVAYLFLAAFAAVSLFVFFWGEAFFSRNIADLRPLFEWMPLLLVFLASSLTMRLWSEERRSGTIEYVLTQPVPLWAFVLGKFVACLALLALALAITLPLPLTVAWLGELDWGPVWAGYLAAFLLGAAYLSIGLFVSARSDNQIVSLILSVAICGAFYLIGSDTLTAFFGNQAGEWLRLLGTGARFEAITRGVIDFRDLYYYLSLIAVFLALNTYLLERERWAAGNTARHAQWRNLTLLLVANVLGANLWLGQLPALRVDTTEGNQYSISEATRRYLGQLQEPLLLRGYFSAKTHPLLAPLVPQLRDLMQEYAVVGEGRVRVEFADPVSDGRAAEEAQQFGIEAVPFQVADRYQSAIVSSWFNVLVKYGDEYEVLDFSDLIEVRSGASGDLEVQLRNPEHDLTRAVRSVLHAYQAGGNLFETVRRPLTFTGYLSPAVQLPEELAAFRAVVEEQVEILRAQSEGQLRVEFIDPEAGDAEVAARIQSDYGFSPLTTSLLGSDSFYFYLTLSDGEQVVQIPLEDLQADSLARNLEAGVKRFASGFTRTVAVVTPAQASTMPMSMTPGATASFNQLRAFLGAELQLLNEDLSDGQVSGEADLLLLLAPENLGELELFAIDQFLMQGGTVIAATSPFRASLMGDSLTMQAVDSGLQDWLAHHGIGMEDSLVMDPRSAAFPLPVSRNVGGFMLRQWQMLDYPYFLDVRGEGLNETHLVTGDLPQVTLAWSSPLSLDPDVEAGQALSFTPLLRSSPEAWLSDSLEVLPQLDASGRANFEPAEERGTKLLGVAGSGRFSSYFAGRESPLVAAAQAAAAGSASGEGSRESSTEGDEDSTGGNAEMAFGGVIERSPESARLLVIASNDFLSDTVISLLGTASGSEYRNSLQLIANSIDWALEDTGLLSIRARSNFNRTLPPLAQNERMFWEYLNYALAGLAIAAIALLQLQQRRRREQAWQGMIEA